MNKSQLAKLLYLIKIRISYLCFLELWDLLVREWYLKESNDKEQNHS